MNHTTTSDAHSLAIKNFRILALGGNVKCPYDKGTKAYEIYNKQMKRMEGLSNG